MEDEFEKGLREGTWIFLFDSFDEIPDVLSVREVDPIIIEYADAISDFLLGMNRCRGIVASRYFRGPGHVDWPHFNIVGLTVERQVQLIKKAKLKNRDEQLLIGELASARSEIQSMASNPLFLSMVIEHNLSGQDFPENTFTVFESYITQRFEIDKERLQKIFGLDSSDVRRIAEIVAFCMTADSKIGLSPYREDIENALVHLDFKAISNIDVYLDALEFIKLGRSEVGSQVREPKSFSFSHRRFQEYFATSFVLKSPERINTAQLISDARWRETAVVLCQTQQEEDLHDFIFEAGEKLYQYALEIENWLKTIEDDDDELVSIPIDWPSGLLYLLSLLQDGFHHRKSILPEYIRSNAGFVLHIPFLYGIFPDKKWSLEVAGIAHQSDFLDALRQAIQSSSTLLNKVAYEQVSELDNIPDDVSMWIRNSLIERAGTGQLRKQRFTTQAFLSRLANRNEYLRLLRLLLIVPILDILLVATSGILIFASMLLTLNATTKNFGSIFVLYVAFISSIMPLAAFIFTYTNPREDKSPMFGIIPLSFSFLTRLVVPFFIISYGGRFFIKSALALTLGYLLLLPVATIHLNKG